MVIIKHRKNKNLDNEEWNMENISPLTNNNKKNAELNPSSNIENINSNGNKVLGSSNILKSNSQSNKNAKLAETSLSQLSSLGGNATALVLKLKMIQSELSSNQQEDADKTALFSLTQDLASPMLIEHKDRGVRILTACCIADILRLYAPDAPYSQQELRNIFELFIREMENLQNKNDAYYTFYHYLIDSLSTVRSFVLLNDLEADELLFSYFKTFLKIVSTDTPKGIYACMVDILKELIEESNFLPMSIVELIFSYFRKKRQMEHPAAFKMVVDLCTASSDKLQRYAYQYISEDISENIPMEDHLEESGNRKTFERAHRLILELGKHVPDILLSVIPILEAELGVSYGYIRLAATSILAELFLLSGSNFSRNYPSTWKLWLGRIRDQDFHIRSKIIEYSVKIITNHPNLAHDLDSPLKDSIIDKDVNIRVLVLQTLGKLNAASLRHIDSKCLLLAGSRLRDKKQNVRLQAIDTLSNIFDIKYNELVVNGFSDYESISKYMWIPGEILASLYSVRDDLSFKAAVDESLTNKIFPLESDDNIRTNRLLYILSKLDSRQFASFNSFLDRQVKTMEKWTLFLNLCEIYNGGIILSFSSQQNIMKKYGNSNIDSPLNKEVVDNLISALSNHICALLPEAKKAEQQLRKLISVNDSRIYKLFRMIMNPQYDYTGVLRCRTELIQRLEEKSIIKVSLPDESSNALISEFPIQNIDNMITIINRVGLTIISKGTIPVCMDRISSFKNSTSTEEKDICLIAEKLLKIISESIPELYQSNLDKLIESLNTTDPDGIARKDVMDETCEALCRFAKSYPEKLSLFDDKTIGRLSFIAKSQVSEIQVLNSVSILAFLFRLAQGERRDNLENICKEVLNALLSQCKMPDKLSILKSIETSQFNEMDSDSNSDSSELSTEELENDTHFEYSSGKRQQPIRAVRDLKKRRRLTKKNADKSKKTLEINQSVANKMYDEKIRAIIITLLGLAEFMYYMPGMIAPYKLTITNFVIKEILLDNTGLSNERNIDWKDFEKLPSLGQLKVVSLQLLVKYCSRRASFWTSGYNVNASAIEEESDLSSSKNSQTSFKNDIKTEEEYNLFYMNDDERIDSAKPILKLLKKIVNNEGELVTKEAEKTPDFIKSALRLQAIKSLLDLAKDKPLCTIDDMLYISLALQDPLFQIRSRVASYLCNLIDSRELPFKYITLFSILACEPDSDLCSKAQIFIKRTAIRQRKEIIASMNLPPIDDQTDENGNSEPVVSFRTIAGHVKHPLVEHTIPRIIYLLAKHPDFNNDADDLLIFARYVEFYLDAILSHDCVSFLYYVASKIKMYRDVNGTLESSKNIYTISEMTQLIIQKKAKSNQWILDSYNGHAMIPTELFSKLVPREATENSKTRYLPENFRV